MTSSLVPYTARTRNSRVDSSYSMSDPPSVCDSSTAWLTIVERTSSTFRDDPTALLTSESASS